MRLRILLVDIICLFVDLLLDFLLVVFFVDIVDDIEISMMMLEKFFYSLLR